MHYEHMNRKGNWGTKNKKKRKKGRKEGMKEGKQGEKSIPVEK